MFRLFFALMSVLPFYASTQDIPKLTLSASATLSKPADELQLKIGVVTFAQTAQEALRENSEKMNRLFTHLEELGFNGDDFETHKFTVNPSYAPTPKDPPPFWHPTINGYEVTNAILIHTSKLEMTGQIIDSANQAGANSISDIRFALRSPRKYWTEALSAAGSNAVRDAEAIAQATGVQLIRVLSISLNHTQIRSPHLNVAALAKGENLSTPIEPGDVSIEANVTLVYEIGN